jgi:hypothetical protein
MVGFQAAIIAVYGDIVGCDAATDDTEDLPVTKLAAAAYLSS